MSFLSVIDNTLSLNSQEHDYLIELCFVTPNNGEMSPEMAMAYEVRNINKDA